MAKNEKANRKTKQQQQEEEEVVSSDSQNEETKAKKTEQFSSLIIMDDNKKLKEEEEKFVELFYEEAYACASLDRKKKVDYKHLSSVIPKRRRFDFLADFVPEKVKVEDAVKEVPSVET